MVVLCYTWATINDCGIARFCLRQHGFIVFRPSIDISTAVSHIDFGYGDDEPSVTSIGWPSVGSYNKPIN